MTSAAPAPLIDEARAAFIQAGLAIDAASHEEGLVPVVARAIACRVSGDRRRVTLLLAATHNRRFLDAVAASGAVAAVFCHPASLETVQLKGHDAVVSAAEAGDDALAVRAADTFVATVGGLGFSETVARRELHAEPHGLAAVTFTVAAAFVQTPGPTAGARI